MSDVLITPASSKIEFKDASNNIDGIIQLDASGNLEIQAPNGDIAIGDLGADVYIGDGINNVDIVFEQNGEIRGLTGVTLTLGQSDSSITVASNMTINKTLIFPDNSSIPDVPTGTEQFDYMKFGAHGSLSQISGRGALMFVTSDDTMLIGNGDVTDNFNHSNIDADNEILYLCSDGNVIVKTDLQEGWGTEYTFTFDNTGNFTAPGNVTAYSDQRLKDNLSVISDPIDKIKQIRGLTYTRKDLRDGDKLHTGVIAQEVEKVLPEVIETDKDGYKTVAYGNMVGLLIEAIKDQQKQIDELKKKLSEG